MFLVKVWPKLISEGEQFSGHVYGYVLKSYSYLVLISSHLADHAVLRGYHWPLLISRMRD